MAAAAVASTSAASDDAIAAEAAATEAEEEPSKWPWLYKPAEWDPPQVKEAYENLLKDDTELVTLDFEEKEFPARVDKFLYTRKQSLQEIPADSADGVKNMKISYKLTELSLLLPEFVADVAPRRILTEGDAKRGEKMNPIFGEDIRYACIAPGYTQNKSLSGYTVVMLSLWIKPRPGYKSKEEEAEETMNLRQHIVSYPRNEEWAVSNLFFAMKDPKDALMFINAVSKLIFTCALCIDKEIDTLPAKDNTVTVRKHAYFRMRFEKSQAVVKRAKPIKTPELRVTRVRPVFFGYLEVRRCTVEQRDKIDEEREAAAPEEDSSDDDETSTRLETDAEPEEPKAPEVPVEATETEKTLVAEVVFAIVDEERIGLYENPYCERALYDLRFYQNQTPVSIELIYLCKKTNRLEIQQEKGVFIVQATEKDQECFKKLDQLVKERKIKAKPKKIFTDVEQFVEHYDSIEIKLNTPEEIKAYQRKMLERLNAQNKTFAESLGNSLSKTKLPPGFPGVPGAPPRAPSPPPAPKNWLRLVLNGSHLKDVPDEPELGQNWAENVESQLTNMLSSKSTIEPAALDCPDGGDEDLRNVLSQIRQHLHDKKCKPAIAKLKGARELFGGDLLSAINGVSDIDVLERIFFLPSSK